jgi:hypothetical protein
MSSIESDPTAELENLLSEELLGKPKASVAVPEDAPEVVRDAPPRRDSEPPATPPELPKEPAPEPEEGEPEEDGEGESEEVADTVEPYIDWATRKYGDDPNKWAKAARDMETHISRLTEEKHASDELAASWYEYAQQAEQSANASTAMPLSAQEEAWVENSLANPLEYARQAAFNGKVQLFNGVMERVAMENPSLAAQIGTQVQVELQEYVRASEQAPPPASLEQNLSGSFTRLGIDLRREGPRMSEKLGELGEYHPYVRAILDGNQGERDLAVQAVHDLTRATTFNSRTVERSKAVAREEELRHQAGVVQTGGVQPPVPPRKISPLEEGMMEEWKRAGAWPSDEG